MSTSSDNKPNPDISESHEDGPVLEWSTHPMRLHPRKTVLAVVAILASGAMVYVATDYSKILTVFTLVVLFMSLAKFFLRTRYIMNAHGLIVRTTTQKIEKPWSMYRSFYTDKNGLLLSPFAEPTRLENFRGIFILFNNNRDEVVEFVGQYVGTGKDSKGESA